MTVTTTAWKRRCSVPLVALTGEELAAVFRGLRRGKRMSAEAAAKFIGVSDRTYSRWESGKTKSPHLANIDKAIRAYGVDPSVFLGQPEVTPGDVATRLEGLEAKVDRLVSELLPAVAALEADLHRLALATESNGQKSSAKPSRRKAS